MNQMTTTSPEHFTALNEIAIREVNRIINTMAVPKELKGRPEEIHSLVNIAMNLGVPVEAALNNCHVIHGRVGFDAKFLIAIANRSGKLDQPLYYMMDEQRTQWCYAVGFINGVEYRGPTVSIEMARKENWKAKWNTLPELMLQYRSAAFFIKTVMPEILMGADFSDEIQDATQNQRTRPDPQEFIEGEAI